MKTFLLKTPIGNFKGNEKERCLEFLGIKYAEAKRFEYASLIEKYDEVDATKPGETCMQKRAWDEFEHLEVPERAFYHKEFRQGIEFKYGEDGLRLNIFAPKQKGSYPVIVFVHGGGFDSGSINESPFDGEELASRGNVVVFIEYRVGVFGYYTNEEIYKKYNRDGNFGLDDIASSFRWVRNNISNFYGDENNITAMGQSAGAMSIQYLLCYKKEKLFDKAIMMSGAGLFPKFSLPLPFAETRNYWKEVMEISGHKSFEEFKNAPAKDLLAAVDKQKTLRKDNTRNTMPVIDGYLIENNVDIIIKNPTEMPLIVGFTNNDMFTFIIANMAKKYAKEHNGYLYYFDIDAKGDNNQAFHSSDLRYAFGTLKSSWRPYDDSDEKASKLMMDYFSNFAKTGNPNSDNLPKWDLYKNKVLCFTNSGAKMGKANSFRLIKNTFKGDPK